MHFTKAVIASNQEIYSILQKQNSEKLKQKQTRGFGDDISISIDLKAERIFIEHLSFFGKIFSEESGYIGEGEDIIVIDPIDGSDNYCSNIPYFGTSVALISKEQTTHAIITNLANGDIYIKNKSIFQKQSLFNKNSKDIIKNSYANVGIYEREYASKELSNLLKNSNIKYRSLGAFAISLSLSHEVDFVLFEGKVREFDIAAGWMMSEDLYRFKDEKYLLVSKDKVTFDKIFGFIKQ